MEQLEGTVTMPLIVYQKLRNDASQIFDSHGTDHNLRDEKIGIWLYLNQEKLFELAWEEMIRRGIDVLKYDRKKATYEDGFVKFGFKESQVDVNV
jgi:hypothetical protein|nr:MAG TPA: hypothetical protein [Siphoviridae sp. ctdzB12]